MYTPAIKQLQLNLPARTKIVPVASRDN